MPEVELIQDEIYRQCWDNIKSTVRTNINVPKDEVNILKLIKKIDKYESIANVIPTLCKEIIKNTLPNNLNTASVIVIDTETTGLDCITDELLQVSIISDTRETLYNSYLRPLYHTVWTEAEKINGISPDMVKDSPTVLVDCVKINDIVSQADVIIGYNQDFDLGFLANIGCEVKKDAVIIDVMKLFAEIYGEWSDYFGGYKWQKLTTCATYYGYEWKGNAHDSLADCLATLYCYEKMKNGEI